MSFELVVAKIASFDWSAIAVIITGILGAYKTYIGWDRKNKVQFILDHIPAAWALTEKIAKATKGTKADDVFVEKMRIFLNGFGWELKASEIPAIKLQGSAYHQTMKEINDPLVEQEND